ncbi:MAG TPA: aspartyl protease family protein [Steroidobacteraceae bacterium]|nr:aspartyl protease family protein [Steroidobacteraceae bacterium]
MKTFLRAVCVLTLLPVISLAAAPPVPAVKPDPSDLLFAAPTHSDRVGRIVVPVWIDGKGPYRFLVDTGADGSLVSSRLVRALGLVANGTPDEQVQGTTGIEQMPCVTIDTLRIGSITKHNVRVPVSNSPVMTGLDGILGMAGFGAVRVMVDFEHNKVAIDRTSRGLPSDFLDIPAERTSGGLLVIPARVGGVEVAAVLDTGATETMGNAALRQALLRAEARNATQARIYGVTRQVSNGGISHSPTVYIGGAEIRNLGIVYSNIPIFRIWHLDSQPALIIGMNALGVVDALVLDYPRSRVYLRPVPPQGLSVAVEDIFLPNGTTDSP